MKEGRKEELKLKEGKNAGRKERKKGVKEGSGRRKRKDTKEGRK